MSQKMYWNVYKSIQYISFVPFERFVNAWKALFGALNIVFQPKWWFKQKNQVFPFLPPNGLSFFRAQVIGFVSKTKKYDTK